MRILAALFMAYGAYTMISVLTWARAFGYQLETIIVGLMGIWAAVTGAGLWNRKHWSQYFVYATSGYLIILWLVEMNTLLDMWVARNVTRPLIALLVVCLPLVLGAALGVYVYRSFHPKD